MIRNCRLVPVLAVGGALSCGGDRGNSQAVAALLETYAPGLHIGQTVLSAKASLPGVYFPGGSSNLEDTTISKVDQFQRLVLLLTMPEYDMPPADDDVVTAVELWSTDSSTPALAEARLLGVFHRPPKTGCLVSPGGKALSQVRYWIDGDYGAALETPISNHRWTALLTIFHGSWGGERLVKDCP